MTGYFGNSSMSNKNSNVYKEKLRILSKNFKLTPEQLSRLFNIPISKINNVKDEEMTNNEKEKNRIHFRYVELWSSRYGSKRKSTNIVRYIN